MRAPGLDLLRRAWRAGEACAFFDGSPELATTHVEREVRRASLVAANPSASLLVRDGAVWMRTEASWRQVPGSPWDQVRAFLPRGAGPTPLVVALLSYDAGRLVETMPDLARDDLHVPDILLHRFDAEWRIGAGEEPVLEGAPAAITMLAERAKGDPAPVRAGSVGAVRSAMPREEFEAMVARAQAHVRAGDVFQVNLSHRMEATCTRHPLDLYARLRQVNPAPFSAFFSSGPLPGDEEGFHVLSASPERLFQLQAGRLEARPIAGTRPRGSTPEADARLAAELRADGKEQAEHVMMVDLARNDLGRVARFGTVRAPRLLDVESYRTVHHLVSTVDAELASGRDVVDAIRAIFPGATITGAPKVRSMEIIEALEPTRRGIYTGSLGWIAGGDADFNILIRTLLLQRDRLTLQAGAGIVEDSVPAREYEETLAKARGLLLALEES